MPLLPPMGEEAERKLRAEMAYWSEESLIAKTVKSPGMAGDIAARQILEKRRSTKETRRFHITTAIGLVGLALSAVAAWFAWQAVPQTSARAPEAQQVPASTPSSAVAQPMPSTNSR